MKEVLQQAIDFAEYCLEELDLSYMASNQAKRLIEKSRQAIAEAEDNYQGSDAAKAAHMMDLYTALGVKWGEDPFAVIAKMRSIAEAEKQPTGPATSADRYFYEAGFEAGRQQGMKQERALWELARIGQEIEAEAEPSRSDIKQEQGEPVALAEYDAGSLNDYGGGNVSWWWDYIRYELGRAHDHYQEQVADLYNTPQQRKPLTDEQIVSKAMHLSGLGTSPDVLQFARAIEAAHGIIKTYPEKDKT